MTVSGKKHPAKCPWCAEIRERVKENSEYFKCPFCAGFPKVNGVEFRSGIYYNYTCKKHEKDLMELIDIGENFGEELKQSNLEELKNKVRRVIEDNLSMNAIGKTMKDWEAIPVFEEILKQLEISQMLDHGMRTPKYLAWAKREKELEKDQRRISDFDKKYPELSDLPTNEEIDEVYAKDRGLTHKEWEKKHGQ